MSVIDKIHMLKKILKEADNIVAWQEEIYTALNVLAGKTKAGNVTDTTGADGKISVTFATPFVSTPVVVVQLEGDVDYYPVITAKDAAGFTVKILKTAHLHSQGNTGAEAAHTHGISFTSGAGSSHRHSNPSTSAVSAGTPSGSISSVSAGIPSGTIGAEPFPRHTHGISLTSGAGSAHHHTQGSTGVPSAFWYDYLVSVRQAGYCAEESGGETTKGFWAVTGILGPLSIPTNVHTHTNPDTGNESSHTHSVSGTSGAGSSHSHSFSGNALATHNHTFTGSALGTHSHTQSSTGYESSHTHSISGTSGAGSSHSHTNPDTSEVNAGNLLATTEVTFSYIAMLP